VSHVRRKFDLDFYSDRGSECGAETFDAACRRLGVVQSVGRAGAALDNAAAAPPPRRCRRFATRAAARAEIGAWISGFYNARRRHSACGGLSPIAYGSTPSPPPTCKTRRNIYGLYKCI
jgi:putative transposase